MFVTSAMKVLVAAAVFVTLLCCGALGSSHDNALSGDGGASLLDRMKAQESLNQELAAKLLRHEDTITQQTNFNQDLTTKLLRHEDKLSQQENLNRDLTTRLARQDGTLLKQGRLIQQLRSVVAASRASAAVSRASVWADNAPASRHVNAVDVMDEPDSVMDEPDSVMDEPDSVMDEPDPETSDSRADSAVSGRMVAKQSDSIHNVAQKSAAVQNVAKQPDSGHNVVKRSDDGGPLEAVVNQISQRVTEMGAELQALKSQTASDLNALKTQTTADVQTLQNIDRQQDQNIHDARSSTFVRWGSSTCGNSSSLVYSGIVGGSWYGATGAATNYLCLTLSPVPSQRAPPASFARLYGAEYETEESHQNQDPLCAVCRAAFSTTVMVPGTDTCSPGWHRHYSGFLMATNYGHVGGSQFICVDPAMESAPHGDANEDGRTLYYTLTRCGSLPCGPYVNNKVVTCAVCSM